MPQKERQAPPLDTAAGLLLTLTALSGEFPTALVRHLPGGDVQCGLVKNGAMDGNSPALFAAAIRSLQPSCVLFALVIYFG